MNHHTVGAKRLLEQIDESAGQGMAAIPKLPGIAGNLARVILSQARTIDELHRRVTVLENNQGNQGLTQEDDPPCPNPPTTR